VTLRRSLAAGSLLAIVFLARAADAPLPKDSGPPAPPAAGEKDTRAWDPSAPWVLAEDLKAALARQAETYHEYALRFTCTEVVRLARYGDTGAADKETTRKYAYLLERETGSETLLEVRQRTKSDGSPHGDDVKDEEPFPPAYGWVFLFSSFHQPYFAYRDHGDRFEGFDWVREIEFKGSLPFTDGKDIRQWQGTVLVDAVTSTPLEIEAEPSGQADRIKALFDRWSQAFNLIGIRLAPRPFGYRCHVRFHTRKDSLTFPTQLRYDTFRAVSAKKNVPWQASIRDYHDYRFFKTSATEGPTASSSNGSSSGPR
jgi:hypothetical protein